MVSQADTACGVMPNMEANFTVPPKWANTSCKVTMPSNVRPPHSRVKSAARDDNQNKSPTNERNVKSGTIPQMPRSPTREIKPGASDFAKERAALIREAREHREPEPWSQTRLAESVEVTRETVYQWESAGVEEIGFVTCVRVAAALGLELSDLLTEAQRRDMQSFEPLPGISPQARRIARTWDSLPPALRNWIWNAVESYQRLAENHPLIAQAITPDTSSTGTFRALKSRNNQGD